jgi:3-methyladenine DNA glycosylase/8-oxoguanine DNA glycosylase
MTPDAETVVELEGPYSLRATMKRYAVFGSDPTVRVRREETWVAFRTASGPASVRYEQRGQRVHVEAWGEGARDAIAAAPEHLGAHDATWKLEVDHPLAGPMVDATRGLRFGRTRRMIDRLLPVVIGQKVTADGAARSFRELVWRYGERAPGPNEKLWIAPTAARLRELSYFDFHPLGVERRRAETLLFAARRAKRLEALALEEPSLVHARLLAFPGIGEWTAGLMVSGVHGDPDALPVGDYHIKNHVAFTLAGEARADDARMLELLEPFRPHRGRVLAALLAHGEHAPRFGPRLSVRDIRE